MHENELCPLFSVEQLASNNFFVINLLIIEAGRKK